MAIPAKREAGTWALWLGLRGYATLGYEAIPRAKQSRAISMRSSIGKQRGMRNDYYAQLRGLLQHLVPFSLGTCAMCHMHASATAAAHLGPAGWMNANEEMLVQVAVWITTLTTRPGVSVLVVVSELETDPTDDEAASATLCKCRPTPPRTAQTAPRSPATCTARRERSRSDPATSSARSRSRSRCSSSSPSSSISSCLARTSRPACASSS